MTTITVLEFSPSNNINSTNDVSAPTKVKNWCGRGASALSYGVSKASDGIVTVAQKMFSSMNYIFSDTSATAGFFRKFDHHILRFLEHVGNAPGKLSIAHTHIRRNVAFIDFVQVIADVEYFVRGKFKASVNEKGEIKPRDTNAVIGGKFSFMVADMCGALLWLNEMSFISLSKAATAIGEARVFNVVPKIISSIPVLRDMSGLQKVAKAVGEFRLFSFVKNTSMLFVTLRAIDLGYALFAIDAGRRLLNASNDIQKISASLDLSSYLAELTLSAIMLAGVTNVVGLGIVGITCVTLAVTSALYRAKHEDQIKPKSLLPAQV
ncbi:MAG TPA: hypothetical protein VGP47_04590 [Parachlamydiaceae bacterium]|nr:hypothetical protein [Parachlamydiaceae bacterium]